MQPIVAKNIRERVLIMSVGERITELRKKAKLSQGQLAAMLDVSRQAVSKWENDQATPDALRMIHLADALNSDVAYIATGKTETPPEQIIIEKVRIQEKIVEKPVVYVEEKPVVSIVEKPVIKKVVRVKYLRSPVEYGLVALVAFFVGFILGKFL